MLAASRFRQWRPSGARVRCQRSDAWERAFPAVIRVSAVTPASRVSGLRRASLRRGPPRRRPRDDREALCAHCGRARRNSASRPRHARRPADPLHRLGTTCRLQADSPAVSAQSLCALGQPSSARPVRGLSPRIGPVCRQRPPTHVGGAAFTLASGGTVRFAAVLGESEPLVEVAGQATVPMPEEPTDHSGEDRGQKRQPCFQTDAVDHQGFRFPSRLHDAFVLPPSHAQHR